MSEHFFLSFGSLQGKVKIIAHNSSLFKLDMFSYQAGWHVGENVIDIAENEVNIWLATLCNEHISRRRERPP